MDIKTLLDNLHEEVSCSVCMTTFTEPKQLPCLHSFCLHCLAGIHRNSGRHDVITCPECRKESRVPGGNLRDLPTNFRINSLLDVLAIKECSSTGVKCRNCDKRRVQSFYCFQCCAFWCEECIIAHNLLRENNEHQVLALKDFEDQDIENVLKRPAFCSRQGHEKKELEFFCVKCEETVCSSCVVTGHDGHIKVLLEEAAKESKSQVMFTIESNKAKAKRMRKKISKLDENCDNIEANVAKVKRSAQQFAESIIAVIQAKKKEIFNEADHMAQQSQERLRIQRIEMEQKLRMIETAVAKAETLLKRSTNAELAKIDKTMNTIIPNEVDDEREELDCDLEGLRRLIFVENEALKAKTIHEEIGRVLNFRPNETKADQSTAEGKGLTEAIVGIQANFVLTTKNAIGQQCYEKRDRVTVEIKHQQGHDWATEVRVKDNNDGSHKVSYFPKETGRFQTVVKVNEEEVRGSPFLVQVLPRQFRPVLSFGQQGSSSGMLSKPWGVAVNERNEIAVTEVNNHRVQVFSCDGTYLRSFGIIGDKQGELNWPAGIAFDKNNNIIVVDRGNNRVQLFSDQGEYLSQFGAKGILHHQLFFPHGLSVENNGNIIIADSNNKLIKIFSPRGHYLNKFGGEGSLTYPFHCIQYEKYLIVSDKHCIKVFDRNGNFLFKFGKKGKGDGEFYHPHGLSVNKAGHLMVCDSWNDRVQVFDLSGKFITKFGSKGGEKGEFNLPVSTAVLSDGRIVVSDICNHRIQIFE